VIGAGVVGLATAYELCKDGDQISVVVAAARTGQQLAICVAGEASQYEQATDADGAEGDRDAVSNGRVRGTGFSQARSAQ
jgi:glycine/D-amino acid oxidase-like deaminating enzyme